MRHAAGLENALHPRPLGVRSQPHPGQLAFLRVYDTFSPSHRGGSGSPLVCLHGFTDTWRTWELVLPILERQHDVLAPTLPRPRRQPRAGRQSKRCPACRCGRGHPPAAAAPEGIVPTRRSATASGCDSVTSPSLAGSSLARSGRPQPATPGSASVPIRPDPLQLSAHDPVLRQRGRDPRQQRRLPRLPRGEQPTQSRLPRAPHPPNAHDRSQPPRSAPGCAPSTAHRTRHHDHRGCASQRVIETARRRSAKSKTHPLASATAVTPDCGYSPDSAIRSSSSTPVGRPARRQRA
jgi:hypothetical protein